MDDLDVEILALAGLGGDAEQFSASEAPPSTKKRSGPPITTSPRTKKARSSKKSSKRTKKRDESNDDEQESELSDAPNSDHSEEGEASEHKSLPIGTAKNRPTYASSDTDDEPSVFELYPYEGVYKDAADKARLMAMSEIDREAVLTDRATEVERAQQDLHLRNLLRSQPRASAAGSGGAGGSSDEDSDNGGGITRRSTRTQNMPQAKKLDSKKGKLDEIKRAREERSTRKDKASSVTGDDDISGSRRIPESEEPENDDQDDPFAGDLYTDDNIKTKTVVEDREVTLSDINRARIGRTGLAKLCYYPGFEKVMPDCFVRVCLHNRETGESTYRLAVVKDVIQGKPYTLLEGNRRTDKHLQLVQGKSERSFNMDLMSDRPITESEFNRFKNQLLADGVPMPSLKLVARKANELRELDNLKLTDEQLTKMLEERKRGSVNLIQLKIEKGGLQDKLENARLMSDIKTVQYCEAKIREIEEIEERHQPKKPSIDNSKTIRHVENIRRSNIKEGREAQLQEMRARLKRRTSPPKTSAGSVASSSSVPELQKTSLTPAEKAVAPVSQKVAKGKGIDEVIANLDIAIEIDI